MIHVVFQGADVNVLQKAIALDENLQGEIIHIKDDFAIGPIENIYEVEGYEARREWWKDVLQFSPYIEQLNVVNDKLTVHQLLERLDSNESQEVWIWMAQNQHDVCGYYWLISQLKNYVGKIQILYLNNLPFLNEKGMVFYPTALHEIQPKEFLKAKKLARPITLSEFEIDPDEWKKLCIESAMVRILEGAKKIGGKDVSFYDQEIIGAINTEPQKLSKVLHHIFSKAKIKTGDAFLVWRMRKLAEVGLIEIIGDWEKGWKEISIKVAGEVVITNELTLQNT